MHWNIASMAYDASANIQTTLTQQCPPTLKLVSARSCFLQTQHGAKASLRTAQTDLCSWSCPAEHSVRQCPLLHCSDLLLIQIHQKQPMLLTAGFASQTVDYHADDFAYWWGQLQRQETLHQRQMYPIERLVGPTQRQPNLHLPHWEQSWHDLPEQMHLTQTQAAEPTQLSSVWMSAERQCHQKLPSCCLHETARPTALQALLILALCYAVHMLMLGCCWTML